MRMGKEECVREMVRVPGVLLHSSSSWWKGDRLDKEARWESVKI